MRVIIHDLPPPMRKSSRQPTILSCRTEYFKNSFFPSVVNDWSNLYSDIHDSRNYSIFCKSLLKFIRPVEGKTYHVIDSVRIKLLTRLKLSFSHLHKYKFSHSFKDLILFVHAVLNLKQDTFFCAVTFTIKVEQSS